MNVYDFDNTIYNGESSLHFFFYYLKKTPYLIKYIPKVFYVLIKYKLGKMSVEYAIENYAVLIEDYFKSIEDFDADVIDFWNKHEKNIKPFYKEIQKEDDIIVTASPEASMNEICKRLGIKHCIGTLLDPKTGKITRLCMRSHKIPAFLEAFPDAHIDSFYTDSPKNDAPLIDMAEHAFIVKGNKITQIK
ncbi:MAG: haloacid dehalogenase-like hydrolase [Oscillospiraceae bacterium]|nr:haloacid dehalogenase-like hydrolase [Oscillospiraceae bacterium]